MGNNPTSPYYKTDENEKNLFRSEQNPSETDLYDKNNNNRKLNSQPFIRTPISLQDLSSTPSNNQYKTTNAFDKNTSLIQPNPNQLKRRFNNQELGYLKESLRMTDEEFYLAEQGPKMKALQMTQLKPLPNTVGETTGEKKQAILRMSQEVGQKINNNINLPLNQPHSEIDFDELYAKRPERENIQVFNGQKRSYTPVVTNMKNNSPYNGRLNSNRFNTRIEYGLQNDKNSKILENIQQENGFDNNNVIHRQKQSNSNIVSNNNHVNGSGSNLTPRLDSIASKNSMAYSFMPQISSEIIQSVNFDLGKIQGSELNADQKLDKWRRVIKNDSEIGEFGDRSRSSNAYKSKTDWKAPLFQNDSPQRSDVNNNPFSPNIHSEKNFVLPTFNITKVK